MAIPRNDARRLQRIQQVLNDGPLSLDAAAAAFFDMDDEPLSDVAVARVVQRVDQMRWIRDNVWSFGDDPLTLWMNQFAECGSELAVVECVPNQEELAWSVVVKTPGSDELPSSGSLGHWFAKAQDAAAALFTPPQAVLAPSFG